MQDIDSFVNYSWFPDGSIDWIDCPYLSDVADLFGENQSTTQDDISYDDLEEDDGLGDDSDIEEDEEDE